MVAPTVARMAAPVAAHMVNPMVVLTRAVPVHPNPARPATKAARPAATLKNPGTVKTTARPLQPRQPQRQLLQRQLPLLHQFWCQPPRPPVPLLRRQLPRRHRLLLLRPPHPQRPPLPQLALCNHGAAMTEKKGSKRSLFCIFWAACHFSVDASAARPGRLGCAPRVWPGTDAGRCGGSDPSGSTPPGLRIRPRRH